MRARTPMKAVGAAVATLALCLGGCSTTQDADSRSTSAESQPSTSTPESTAPTPVTTKPVPVPAPPPGRFAVKEIIVENIGKEWFDSSIAKGHGERVNIYFAGDTVTYESRSRSSGKTLTLTLTAMAMEDADRVNVRLAKDLTFITGVKVDGPRSGTLTLRFELARTGLQTVPDSFNTRARNFSALVFVGRT